MTSTIHITIRWSGPGMRGDFVAKLYDREAETW